MKKLAALTTALLIGATLLLAPPANAGVKEDKAFYRITTNSAPALKALSRKELVKTAKLTCKFLRNGFTLIDALDIMEESGLTRKESLAILAGSVVWYCPEQEDNM